MWVYEWQAFGVLHNNYISLRTPKAIGNVLKGLEIIRLNYFFLKKNESFKINKFRRYM